MGMPPKSAVFAAVLVLLAITGFALLPTPETRTLALLGLGYLALCVAVADQSPTEKRARDIAQETGYPLPVARARAVAEVGEAFDRSVLKAVLCC